MTTPEVKKYVRRPLEIEAIQWTPKTRFGDIERFTNYLFRDDDQTGAYLVYDAEDRRWIVLVYNDYIIKIGSRITVLSEKEFMREYTVDPAGQTTYTINTIDRRAE